MKPLHPIGLGLVIIALVVDAGGYDVMADPVGWLLVLAGLREAPVPAHRRAPLNVAALIAAATATVLWFPDLATAVHGTDPALTWAVNLPQIIFTALLCRALAETAREPRPPALPDPAAAAWLKTTLTFIVIIGALPVLVFGGGVDALENVVYVGAGLVLLLLICLLFIYGNRPWGMVEKREAT